MDDDLLEEGGLVALTNQVTQPVDVDADLANNAVNPEESLSATQVEADALQASSSWVVAF